jgi:hypothetical protein
VDGLFAEQQRRQLQQRVMKVFGADHKALPRRSDSARHWDARHGLDAPD